jgi:hypothetical protein
MKAKILIAALVLAPIAGLMGCSTPTAAKTEPMVASLPFEPPIYKMPDGPPNPDSPLVFGHLCKLGTSCLALDPRPFEPCLLSTKSCSEKAAEPTQVAPPKDFIAPPWMRSL